MSRTKEQILTVLLQNKNHYLSGQKISDLIGCSRTAVWKHMNELKKAGYDIESLHKKGYRLSGTPAGLNKSEIAVDLKTKRIGHQLELYDDVVSTQKVAHHLAEDGTPDGTVVVADEQTGGRGRMGRAWHSPKSSGLWMSVVLRPDLPPQKSPQLTLLTAVAVVKAIQKVAGIDVQIKWPNDLLYDGKKVCGILTELQAEADRVRAVVIGIGINVNTEAENLFSDTKNKALSLRMIKGEAINRTVLLQQILWELETLYHTYLEEGFPMVKLMWESYAASLGQKIKAKTVNGQMLEGIAKGINNEGILLLETPDGEIHEIYSADIQL